MAEAAPLLHVGLHKTGTSWIQKQLLGPERCGLVWLGKRRGGATDALVSDHPLDFDPHTARARFGGILDQVRSSGSVPVISLERLSGHPFSGGYDSAELAERLHATFPDGRVLLVIREQTAMIVSIYKQYVKAGGPAPFDRFVAGSPDGRQRIPRFDPAYLAFDRLILRYQALFGADRVLVLAHEQLANDPLDFTRRIVRFAGGDVSAAATVDPAPNNVALGAVATNVLRTVNRLAVVSELQPEPPLRSARIADARRSWARRADRLAPPSIRRRAEQRLLLAAVEVCGPRFGPSNQRTMAATGLPLGALGYVLGAPGDRP